MAGEFEAIGDAATGGMAARAVEPDAGEGAGHTSERACLNCGATLTGPYCSACGQRAHVHRTIGAFFHDLLHGVFHFEGKIWRTLPMLAWKPGELTREYIEGRRATYLSPIALFLFSVFMMFAVVGSIGTFSPSYTGNLDLATSQQASEQSLARLQQQRAQRIGAGQSAVDLDREIADVREDIAAIAALREGKLRPASSEKDGPKGARAVFSSDWPFLENAVAKAQKNPQLLLYKMKTYSYKWSWALIPLSVPFLWLLFPFSRRFHLYDHVVFVTYSLAFMSLLIVVATVVSALGAGALVIFAGLIPPLHMYRQLRGAYQLTAWGAAWRAAALTLVAITVLGAFTLAMVTLGAID